MDRIVGLGPFATITRAAFLIHTIGYGCPWVFMDYTSSLDLGRMWKSRVGPFLWRHAVPSLPPSLGLTPSHLPRPLVEYGRGIFLNLK